jgi:hypothetical protein
MDRKFTSWNGTVLRENTAMLPDGSIVENSTHDTSVDQVQKNRIGYIVYTMHMHEFYGDRRITEWQGSADYDHVLSVFKQYIPVWSDLTRATLPRYIPELQTTLEIVDYVIPFHRMIDADGWSRESTVADTYGDMPEQA